MENNEFRRLNEIAEKYDIFDFDNRLRHFMMRTFAPLLPPGRALELGCLHGNVTELILKYYQDLTVVEAAESFLESTKRRVGPQVKFINSLFENANLPGQYDAIFLMHVLEHLEEPLFVLNKIKNWLSPKGRLFLVVPNANAPSRQIAVKMGLIDYNSAITEAEHKHGHRRTYSLDTLESETRKAGLKVIQRGGVFFKGLANYQFDQAIASGIVSEEYLEGCYQLGMLYPDLCASIYLVCEA